MSLAAAGEVALARCVGVLVAGGSPEERERAAVSAVVPDAGGDRPGGAGHPRHLAQPGHRVGHEVHDQLGQRAVEAGVVVGEVLGGREPDVDLGEAVADRRDERR